MERHEPNATKQIILEHLSPKGSASTVEGISTALGLSRHGAAMCVLRLCRQFLIKEDLGQYPRLYKITDKGKGRLEWYQQQEKKAKE